MVTGNISRLLDEILALCFGVTYRCQMPEEGFLVQIPNTGNRKSEMKSFLCQKLFKPF